MFKKTILLSLTLFLCFTLAYSQDETIKVSYDPAIKQKVLDNIIAREAQMYDPPGLYNVTFHQIMYRNDSLYFDSTKEPAFKNTFSSDYTVNNDMVLISGGYGVSYRGYGFHIELRGKEALVKHRLEFPAPRYYKSPSDEAQKLLLVDTYDASLVLSHAPGKGGEMLYGYLSFKAKDYYLYGPASIKDTVYKFAKFRVEYKFYFQSRSLN